MIFYLTIECRNFGFSDVNATADCSVVGLAVVGHVGRVEQLERNDPESPEKVGRHRRRLVPQIYIVISETIVSILSNFYYQNSSFYIYTKLAELVTLYCFSSTLKVLPNQVYNKEIHV